MRSGKHFIKISALAMCTALVGLFAACTGAAEDRRGELPPTVSAPPGMDAASSWQSALWQWAGHTALAGGEPQAALQFFQRAENPSVESILALGEAYWQLADHLHALQMWQYAQQSGAPPEDVLPRLAQAQRALGDFPAAILSLQTLLVVQPANAQATYQLALLLIVSDPNAAIPYLSLAGEMDASLHPAAFELSRRIQSALLAEEPAYGAVLIGRALAVQNEWDLAAEVFRRAAGLRPDYAEAWAFLGEAQENSGQDGAAALQTALGLDPQSLSANTFMAFYWQRRQNYTQAAEYLNIAIALDPQNPALHAALGSLRSAQGDLPGAAASYLLAAELAPNDPAYWRALAEFSLEYEAQVHDVALSAARRTLLLTPNDPAALDLMGCTLFVLGDEDNAVRFFHRALQQDAAYAPAHLHLGQLYLAAGDLASAHAHLSQAAALAPGTPTAQQAESLLQQYFP